MRSVTQTRIIKNQKNDTRYLPVASISEVEQECLDAACETAMGLPLNHLIADAHRDDGKRFVVRADEKLDCVSGTGNGDSASGNLA